MITKTKLNEALGENEGKKITSKIQG